jgi:pantetheine-phosphate adenylyltransferase
MRKAIYPGTFDPITFGHLDVIKRAAKIFDQVTIAIYDNPGKQPVFTAIERKQLIEACLPQLPNLEVDIFENELLVNYAKRVKATAIVRGLRAISDFETELGMAQFNHRLSPKIETIFFMTEVNYSFLSSTRVREIAFLNGDVSLMVPPIVQAALKQKYHSAES